MEDIISEYKFDKMTFQTNRPQFSNEYVEASNVLKKIDKEENENRKLRLMQRFSVLARKL